MSLNNLTFSSQSRLSRLSRLFRRKGEVKDRIDPELEVNQRVVTFIEDHVSRGTVQKILGLEMVRPALIRILFVKKSSDRTSIDV